MADIIGLAIGVVGLFNDVIDLFNYVQIGKKFGRDQKTCSLQLMYAEASLARWGKSVGLSDVKETMSLEDLRSTLSFPPEDLVKVKATLDQIMVLFEDAKATAAPTAESKTDEVGAEVSNITKALKKVSISRLGKITKRLTRKARWAVADRDELDYLLSGIQGLINSLKETFPATDKEAVIAREEVSKLGLEPPELHELQKFLKHDVAEDEHFKAAVDAEVKRLNTGTTTYNSAVYGDNNSGWQLAQPSGTGNEFNFHAAK